MCLFFSTAQSTTIIDPTQSFLTTGTNPRGVAFSPDGSLLVIPNMVNNTASVYTVSGTIITSVPAIITGDFPGFVAFSPYFPDGRSLLVISNSNDGPFQGASYYTVRSQVMGPLASAIRNKYLFKK